MAKWLVVCIGIGGTLGGMNLQRAHGQGPTPIGVQIGYSRSELGGSDGGLASRRGALAGVYAQERLGGGMVLQPELLFAIKGGRASAALEDGSDATIEVELAYLELPVLLKFNELLGRRRVRPVLFGGIAPSVRIGCDLVLSADEERLQVPCESLDDLAFERFDVGGVVGGGVQFTWSETALALEVRYTTGLRSILGDLADVRNRQVGVMAALSF